MKISIDVELRECRALGETWDVRSETGELRESGFGQIGDAFLQSAEAKKVTQKDGRGIEALQLACLLMGIPASCRTVRSGRDSSAASGTALHALAKVIPLGHTVGTLFASWSSSHEYSSTRTSGPPLSAAHVFYQPKARILSPHVLDSPFRCQSRKPSQRRKTLRGTP